MSVNNNLPTKKHIFPLAGIGINSALHTAFNGNIPESLKRFTQSIPNVIPQIDNDMESIASRVFIENQSNQPPATLKRKPADKETNDPKLQRTDLIGFDIHYDYFFNLGGQDGITQEFLEGLFIETDDLSSNPNFPLVQEAESQSITSYFSQNTEDRPEVLTISEILELPRIALEAVKDSSMGLSIAQISRYFPENNQVLIRDNLFTFQCIKDPIFPNHYECSNPCIDGSTRWACIFWIGKILETIKLDAGLNDVNLNCLILEMTKINPEKRIKPKKALNRLMEIQSSLLNDCRSRIYLEPHLFDQYQGHLQPDPKQPSDIFSNNLKLRDSLKYANNVLKLKDVCFLELCSQLKLSQRLEFSLIILKYLQPMLQGLHERYIHEILPENIFVNFENEQVTIYCKGQTDHVPMHYINGSDRTQPGLYDSGYYKSSNIFTVGKILHFTVNEKEKEDNPSLKELIDSMTYLDHRNRSRLSESLKELLKIQKDLINKGK
ncbi:MAG TPA: hypothetical protein VLG49_02470 [Rhabdochlamydiaceae bacterium]|nr:hypothetical protein [Rhabdochlamydiaceae bacterium]